MDEWKAIMDELKAIKFDVRDIQMTLENETNRNIQIIAEGRLDLSRKMIH